MYIADVNYYGQIDEYGITIDGIDADGVAALNDSGLQEGDEVEIVPKGTLLKLDRLEQAIKEEIARCGHPNGCSRCNDRNDCPLLEAVKA